MTVTVTGINDSGDLAVSTNSGLFLKKGGYFYYPEWGSPSNANVVQSTDALAGVNNEDHLVGSGTYYLWTAPVTGGGSGGPTGARELITSYPAGFETNGTVLAPISYPGIHSHSYAFGINNSDDVVGYYTNDSNPHAFVESGGHYTLIDPPAETGGSWARGINDSGVVVGYFIDSAGAHGFRYVSGVYITLDEPAAANGTFATGVNNLGQVVGYYLDVNGISHGFLLSGGHYTTVDDPSGVGGTHVYGINLSGQMVGDYVGSDGHTHGFVDTGGAFTTIDFAGPSAANDRIAGNSLANTINGMDGNDSILGLGGNDKLYGGNGNDSLSGGDGNDTLIGGRGADHLSGGAGNDRAQYSDASAGLTADLQTPANNTGYALGDTYASIENLYGSNYNDTLRGNSGANTIWGAGGNDTIYGRGGNDHLDGGAGNDLLVGGSGKDVFVFDTALSASTNVDRISDFTVVDDTIELAHAVFTALSAGMLDSSAFHIGAAAANGSQHVIYNTETGALTYDADGNGAGAAVQFATLAKGLALTHSDFVVV